MQGSQRRVAVTLFFIAQFFPQDLYCQAKAPVRDPVALQVIETSIAAMGGATAWSRILDSRTTWEVTSSHHPKYAGAETWADDWRAGYLIFDHEQTTSEGTSSIAADESHKVTSRWPGGERVLPQQTQEVAVPLHLPAATLSLLVNDPHRSITYMGLTGAENSIARISIANTDRYGRKDELTREEWNFDMKTGYPTGVRYYTLELTHNVPHAQTIDYGAYRTYGSVSVPSIVTLNANNNDRVLSLKSFTF